MSDAAEEIPVLEEKSEEMPTPEEPVPVPTPAPEVLAPAPKKRAKKPPTIVEIPVDAPVAEAPAPAPEPKARGRPKGAVGAKKRAQPTEAASPSAPLPTPREEMTFEDHMNMMLEHTRRMQEAKSTATRDKYRSWVV